MAYLLIVDDDEDFADAVATVCRAEGHEVEIVHDAAEVETQLAQRLPDAMILDVMFPENPSGGFELARLIRKRWGEIPVLMLTAVNQQFPLGFSGRDIDPRWLPIHDFVEKPIDFEILKAKVHDLLQRPRQTP
jgi:DNA-binding response OmpR family regulator